MDWLLQLETLVSESKYDMALEFIESLNTTDRQNPEVINILGIICMYVERWSDAEHYCSQAFSMQPENPDYQYNMAYIYYRNYKYQESLEILEYMKTADYRPEDILDLKTSVLEGLKNQKNILFTAYSSSLMNTSNSLGRFDVSGYLPQYGWKPTIISVDDFCSDEVVPAVFASHQVVDNLKDTQNISFTTEEIGQRLSLLNELFSTSHQEKESFQSFLDQCGYINALFFPCSQYLWAYDVIQYIEQNINIADLDAVYTTSTSCSGHLIGYYFKIKHGIPWIAELGAEWNSNPIPEPSKHLFSELTGIIRKTADTVMPLFLSGSTEQELAQKLSELLLAVCEKKKKTETDSSSYNELYQSGGAGQAYFKHYKDSYYYPSWLNAMKYLAFVNRKVKVLEIGCGVGQFANLLFDYGFDNYIGIDYASCAIEQAKITNSNYADNFYCEDVFQSDIIKADYGIVIVFEVLEHLNKDLELLDLIQSGTNILFSVPDFPDPYHVRFFKNEEEIRERYVKAIEFFQIDKTTINPGYNLYLVSGRKR